MQYIKFPRNLKRISDNPLIDFYKKCMGRAGLSSNLNGVSVMAFTINPKDYSYLKKLCITYVKRRYPSFNKKRLTFEIEMAFLDIGPIESNKIAKGQVQIDNARLYEDS
jgi:hypothetical protein